MKFEKFVDNHGRWRFRLRADNGEIVAQSEDYVNGGDCDDTIKAIQKGAGKAVVVEVEQVPHLPERLNR